MWLLGLVWSAFLCRRWRDRVQQECWKGNHPTDHHDVGLWNLEFSILSNAILVFWRTPHIWRRGGVAWHHWHWALSSSHKLFLMIWLWKGPTFTRGASCCVGDLTVDFYRNWLLFATSGVALCWSLERIHVSGVWIFIFILYSLHYVTEKKWDEW